MEDKLLRFQKFIVKKTTNTVDYNPESNEFIINRISLSNEIMKQIFEEGRRYGLDQESCKEVINHITNNIVFSPSTNICKSQFDSRNIKKSQHVEIQFEHERKGLQSVQCIAIDKCRFIVLKSTIKGLNRLDELEPISLIWNPGFEIDFLVYRDGKRYPNVDTKLLIGKYKQVITFKPSLINEILDSEEDFSKNNLNSNISRIKNKENMLFSWLPNHMNPIAFSFNNETKQDPSAPFIIKYTEDSTNADLLINADFRFPTDNKQKEYILQVITDCCVCENLLTKNDCANSISTVKSGVLQKDLNEKKSKRWILVSKPQIKFVSV